MRAVVLEMPPHWLEERRRQGLDRRDEVWDGVLHMVPPPGWAHQMFAGRLEPVLGRVCRPPLVVVRETGIYALPGDKEYRVPDLVVADPKHASHRGVERIAAIAIEILSPNDESRDKLPFYAMCGVGEVWLLDPVSRAFEIYSVEDGYGAARSESSLLGVKLSIVDGPLLRLEWSDGAAEI